MAGGMSGAQAPAGSNRTIGNRLNGGGEFAPAAFDEFEGRI